MLERCVLFFGFGTPGILTWGGIVGYQCVRWLQDGHWLPIVIRDGFHWNGIFIRSTGWVGVDKIIGWLVDFPLSFAPLLFGIGFVGAGFQALAEELKRRDLVRRGLGGPHYR